MNKNSFYTVRIFYGIFFFVSLNSFAQFKSVKQIIPDSIMTLKKGIYFSKEDFLHNSPSVPYLFEVINNKSSYIINPEENNKYYVTYLDMVGQRKTLPLTEIWGFYDGNGVFISYMGKPYQIMNLGAISTLLYEKYFHKNAASQTATLLAVGVTTTDVHKVNFTYLSLENDIIRPAKERNLRKMLSSDAKVYSAYKADGRRESRIKSNYYLDAYNQRHEIFFANNKIRILLKNN